MGKRLIAGTTLKKYKGKDMFVIPMYDDKYIDLSDKMTGRWKETTDRRGVVLMYVEAEVDIPTIVGDSRSIGKWFWKKSEIYYETVIVRRKVWIPERAIDFMYIWDETEEIFNCKGGSL